MEEFLKNYKLTEEDWNEINNVLDNLSYVEKRYSAYETERVKTLYTLIKKTDYTPPDIAEYLGVSTRTVQLQLKKLGWNLNRFEAQRRATLKRNYKEINLKKRKTMALSISGSNIEDKIRNIAYIDLKSNLKNYEVIVGINSPSFVDAMEVDIPIIITNRTSIHRFVIEVDGGYWHEDYVKVINDERKQKELEKMGYKVYRISIEHDYQAYPQLDNIVSEIVNTVNSCVA